MVKQLSILQSNLEGSIKMVKSLINNNIANTPFLDRISSLLFIYILIVSCICHLSRYKFFGNLHSIDFDQ